MENSLKLVKVSASSSLEDIKALFNYNVDQLVLFGGGEKGDQGDTGAAGAQGDQGLCVYCDNNSVTDSDYIRDIVDSKEAELSDNSEDIYVNRIGVFSVSRNGNRDVKLLFAWKKENSSDGTSYIIPETEQQTTPTTPTENFWENNNFGSSINPKSTYNGITLVGDNSSSEAPVELSSKFDSPLNLYQDGSISFLNYIASTKNIFRYSINADYNEIGKDPDNKSGLFLGQVYDSNYPTDSDNLPHAFIDYCKQDNTKYPFTFTNTFVIGTGFITEPLDSESKPLKNFEKITDVSLRRCTYKDKNDSYSYTTFVQGTNVIQTINGTTLTMTVMSNNVIHIEGVIDCKDINMGEGLPGFDEQYLRFGYEGPDGSQGGAFPYLKLLWGHVVNSYGPEHIEFYGNSWESIGMNSELCRFTLYSDYEYTDFSGAKFKGCGSLILTNLDKIGESIVTADNDRSIYVNLMCATQYE